MKLAHTRFTAVDTLRGLVMVLMTLDHTRDFFSNARVKPTDLDHTWPALFLTRWITHFCAPVFIFLAGMSAYLWWQKRGAEVQALQRFLFERGALILLLTLTVEGLAWNFRYDFSQIEGGVLWAIAWSMLALAGLVRLPLAYLTAFALLMIFSHNAFDHWQMADFGAFAGVWSVLHTGEKFALTSGIQLNPYYPLIPWIGVMALGFVFGACFKRAEWRQPRRLCSLGAAITLGFVVLRWSNFYGDPQPWQVYPNGITSVLSFMNVHKYPPSLLYLMMTLGPACMLLALLQSLPERAFAAIQVFGRTPLVFYLLHLYLIHTAAVVIAWLTGGPWQWLMSGGIWQPQLGTDYGYDLPVVYAIWIVMLISLYPACRAFEQLKQHKPQWTWLRYF